MDKPVDKPVSAVEQTIEAGGMMDYDLQQSLNLTPSI